MIRFVRTAIFEEGQCGGIPVMYTLIRIGVLPQSHSIRITFK